MAIGHRMRQLELGFTRSETLELAIKLKQSTREKLVARIAATIIAVIGKRTRSPDERPSGQ